MASSSRLSFWPTSVVCIVSSSLSAVIVLLVVHLVAPPNSRSFLSQLSRDERLSPDRPGELGDFLGGRSKRSLGDLPFYLSAHSAYEQGVFLELFKAVKANETFYDETMKILMPALVQFETIVIKEFRRIHLLIRRHDIRLRQWAPMFNSHRFTQARRTTSRDDHYDDYDYEDSEAKKTTRTTTTTTTTISTTTMTTSVNPEGEEASVNDTSSENSDENEGGGEVSSEEANDGSHAADCPCAVRISAEGSEEDRENSTLSSHVNRNGALSENETSSDNNTDDPNQDFNNSTRDSSNSTDSDLDGEGSKEDLLDDQNSTNTGDSSSRVSYNNMGALEPIGSGPDLDREADRNASYNDGLAYGVNDTAGFDGWNSTGGNGTGEFLVYGVEEGNSTLDTTGDATGDNATGDPAGVETTISPEDYVIDGTAGLDGLNSTGDTGTDDYFDYDEEEGNSTLDATGDAKGDATGDDATGDAAGVGTTISPEGVIPASAENSASGSRGSTGAGGTRVVRPRFDPIPIYRRLNEHSTRLDALKVATDSRNVKDKELDFRLIGLETAQKDQARRLREMETDNVQVNNKVNEMLARLGLGSDDYRTLSLTVGRVERDVTDLKDSLAEIEAEWQELRLDTQKQKQIVGELQTADSYKAHSIREVANLMSTMQGSMQHVLNTVDSYLSGLREEITKHIDDICYNNDLRCY